MSRPGGFPRPDSVGVLGLFALVLMLGGCVAGGDTAEQASTPVYTGSIPVSPAKPENVADRDLVRAAVAASGAVEAGRAGIPWANAATGTTGVITQIVETETGGETCRSFETSRHGYEGIAMYVGEACGAPGGAWRLIEFRPKRGADSLDNIHRADKATG